jgi:carbamoyltransferase
VWAGGLPLDGVGEVQTTVFAEGNGHDIRILDEVLKPDSLGLFYSAMTEYLGFQANDGEYKLMGMAPYGDPARVDLDGVVTFKGGRLQIDTRYVSCRREDAFKRDVDFSRALVERLGPPRTVETIGEPYIHVAAATQKRFEDAALHVIEHHLGPVLRRCGGRLAFAGGCALNVVLNRKLIEHPLVSELYVQPNAGDGGTSLGAAAWASTRRGVPVGPMRDVQLGPEYTNDECRAVLERFRIPYEQPDDIVETTAELLARGKAVGWFHGRMEWGPRALGNRSVLGNPSVKGQTNDINLRVKFREAWRPFCPSILAEWGPKVFDSDHDSPFMTFCYGVRPEWRERIPEVVHVDRSARPQYVTPDVNPRYRAVIERFHEKTGIPCVINTSLNRRGEPIVCSPEDALRMFFGSGLEYLVLEDSLIRKRPGED